MKKYSSIAEAEAAAKNLKAAAEAAQEAADRMRKEEKAKAPYRAVIADIVLMKIEHAAGANYRQLSAAKVFAAIEAAVSQDCVLSRAKSDEAACKSYGASAKQIADAKAASENLSPSQAAPAPTPADPAIILAMTKAAPVPAPAPAKGAAGEYVCPKCGKRFPPKGGYRGTEVCSNCGEPMPFVPAAK